MALVSEEAKQRARDKARDRQRALRASPDYSAYLEKTRERRKQYKAKRRREAGAMPLQEVRAAAEKRLAEASKAREAARVERARESLHCAHVAQWRKSRSGAAWSHEYRTNPEFNAREKVRARLRKLTADSDLQRHLACGVKSRRWNAQWSELLGYSLEQLVLHLRRTLPKGWAWDAFLSGELHIDHITPRSAFNLNDAADVRRCWCLSNLRLLPAKENMRKGARIEVLL